MDMTNGKLDSSTKNAHQLVELEGLRKHQSITSETSFTSMTGGSEFSSHMVQRYPPTYQGGHEEPGLTPVLGSGNGDTISVDPDEYNEAPLTALDDIVFEGYEHVTYEPTLLDPPPFVLPVSSDSHSEQTMETVPHVDDLTARSELLAEVSKHHCWGLTAARELQIKDITHESAFHYRLTTSTETRSAYWVHEPFTDQLMSSISGGIPPKPWDILVVPPNPLQNGKISKEVPHSARIVNCHDCSTLGRRRCWSCFGNGETTCSACDGRGHVSPTAPTMNTPLNSTCGQCGGTARRRCVVCLGAGHFPCKTCLARGRLKLSLRLIVSWKILQTDRVVEQTGIPETILRSVTGRVVFEKESPALWPVNSFPDEEVNNSSRKLIEEHRLCCSNEKILAQKHSIHIVPVHKVHYQWRHHHGEFFVYGFDNRIFLPHYPQRSCCGLFDIWPFNLCF